MKYLDKIPPYENQLEGRGIVICAGGYGYFTCCWVLINTLRHENKCSLPIQVWYKDDEMTPDLIGALSGLDVTCHNISDYTDEDITGWALKPMAILSSSFKEVLFLDADIVCMTNPDVLFDLPEYKENGALFWPDFWETDFNNPIWDILKIPPVRMKEQESGQILIDKERCWKEIHLATYFNINSYIYYYLLFGDKDTFRFAWMALNSPFYLIEREPSSCGYIASDNSFVGHTMIQHMPNGDQLFLHRNLLKWHVIKDFQKKWQVIKRFKNNIGQREYHCGFHPVHKHDFIDLRGDDIEILNFKNEVWDIEDVCHKYLKQLRNAEWYRDAFHKNLTQY